MARTNPGVVAGATTSYAYDGADRVTGLTTAQGVATLGDFGYTYTRGGRVSQATEAVGGTTRTVGYGYDGLGRVAGSTVAFGAGGSTTYAYGYDSVGNRTSVSVNGVATQARSYDAAGQVVGWSYDGAGNLLDDGTTDYTWDPLGRMVGTATGGGTPTTTTYAYTGDGHLLAQDNGTTESLYVLDTAGGLVERLGTTATTGSATAKTWYLRGWGGELAREETSGRTWLLGDKLGSVRGEYAASATVGSRTDYTPFGEPVVGSGLAAPTDYGFTGEPQDPATGLVHLRARWYQPTSATFASRDPFAGEMTVPQSFNPYAYAHNDPVNLTDPTGMSPLFIDAGRGESGSKAQAEDLAGGILRRVPGTISLCPDQLSIFALLLTTAPTRPDLDPKAIADWADRFARSLPVKGGAAVAAGGGAAGATGVAASPVLIAVAIVAAVILAAGFAYFAYQNAGYIAGLGPPPAPVTDTQGRPVAAPAPAPCPLDANGKPNCGSPTTTDNQEDEVAETFRGLDGDLAKDKSHYRKPLYSPSQFRVDQDGVSTFELPNLPSNKPYAVGFTLFFKKPKIIGTRATIGLLPQCVATYTPQYGGDGHWSVNCSSSDTKATLSDYAKIRGAILNPHWDGLPQDRRMP